jgi:hypothetical protein
MKQVATHTRARAQRCGLNDGMKECSLFAALAQSYGSAYPFGEDVYIPPEDSP